MYRRLQDKLGTAGLIVACIALVFALLGGAYAATTSHRAEPRRGLTKAQVLALIKSHRGPVGAKGDRGSKGPKGEPGAKGDPGAAGKGVISAVENAGAHCPQGGHSFEIEGSSTKQYVCNGEAGPALPDLEAGETETGVWGFTSTAAHASSVISLPRIVREHFSEPSWVGVGESEGVCPGTVAEPRAIPGHLCIYAEVLEGTAHSYPEEWWYPLTAPFRGLFMEFDAAPGVEETRGYGTWAATGI